MQLIIFTIQNGNFNFIYIILVMAISVVIFEVAYFEELNKIGKVLTLL
jgi:hypothetical protein